MSMKPFLPSLWPFDEARKRNAFHSFHRELDDLFNDFKRGFQLPSTSENVTGALLAPQINVSETDSEIDITVELPGVNEKDVDVTLTDNILTIKGEKKTETEDKNKEYHIVERSFGSFRRSVALPFEVDADAVKAEFKDGVLKLSLPKPAESDDKTKKISINQT